jgi:hypothetical protein
MYCHGKNFFPSKQYPEVTWHAFIDVMVKGGSDRSAMVRPVRSAPRIARSCSRT